ncbi:MAG: YgiQ family radical SAM protein [Firmicutes bacterium]|nr:YgiQ family radical SAM protein [Bacillota bacterium]
MFLPMNRQDMNLRDWHYLDFLIITGDAVVDHYSFGSPLIARWLEHLGYRVGILVQPDWHSADNLLVMGRPRYGVLISAGNMDSMINHYTAGKKPRRQDAYTPGGKTGRRPDYAAAVYSRLAREAFGPQMPLILGGVEASMRRFAHYDFWSDSVKPSWLMEGDADLLVYGMAELTLKAVAEVLVGGGTPQDCRHIPGLAYRVPQGGALPKRRTLELPSLQQVSRSKTAFAKAFHTIDLEQNFYDGKALLQRHDDEWLVVNPPQRPLTTPEMDEIYELPFKNRWHPSYDAEGGVPAFAEVEFSLLSHRGCFGSCAFCSIGHHQGPVIQNRSAESILREAKRLTEKENFKGYIHDLGGPTANFRGQGCDKAKKVGPCRGKKCLFPEPCKNLKPDMSEYISLLRRVSSLPNVKKVFIRSGIRYDYIMLDRKPDFLRQLAENHVSGHLKVAPEHCQPRVLAAMGKPDYKVYRKFVERFNKASEEAGKRQYLLPYFIAAHPGSTLQDALGLALEMKFGGYQPEQVQLFLPSPGSKSTCMYYTGLNPDDMSPVYVARSRTERDMQRALLHFAKAENYPLVRAALIKLGREDLIGWGRQYLVPPEGQPPKFNSSRRRSKSGQGGDKQGKFTDKTPAKTHDYQKDGKKDYKSDKHSDKKLDKKFEKKFVNKEGKKTQKGGGKNAAGSGRRFN